MSTQTIFRAVGSTSQSTDLSLVQNAASPAPGDPVLGLAFNTSGIQAFYSINGVGALTAVTLATQTPTGAWSSGGLVQKSSTQAPGQYRFDIPNAVLASAGEAHITFSGIPAGTAGNMETHTLKIIVGDAMGIFTGVAMAESVAPMNTAPTPAQALYAMHQRMMPTKRNINGTLETVYKVDGATVAYTYTLDNSSNVTTFTRAT